MDNVEEQARGPALLHYRQLVFIDTFVIKESTHNE